MSPRLVFSKTPVAPWGQVGGSNFLEAMALCGTARRMPAGSPCASWLSEPPSRVPNFVVDVNLIPNPRETLDRVLPSKQP